MDQKVPIHAEATHVHDRCVRRATFRFYAELNDFLPEARRGRSFVHGFRGTSTVKDAIEALGVPHVEVDLIVRAGAAIDFDARLFDGDRIAVYPSLRRIEPSEGRRLQYLPTPPPRFITDVHLRRLARTLRLLGFDTVDSRRRQDEELVDAALQDRRVILTRDRQLLKNGRVELGYWVRETDPTAQAREVVRRFDLARYARPFRRCTICNGPIESIDKQSVAKRIPPKTAGWLDEYYECQRCRRLYWRGTHARRLEKLVARVLSRTEDLDASRSEGLAEDLADP